MPWVCNNPIVKNILEAQPKKLSLGWGFTYFGFSKVCAIPSKTH
jgi:hypothetical protein